MSTAAEIELLHGTVPLFTSIQRHTFFNHLNQFMGTLFPEVRFSFFYHDSDRDHSHVTLEYSMFAEIGKRIGAQVDNSVLVRAAEEGVSEIEVAERSVPVREAFQLTDGSHATGWVVLHDDCSAGLDQEVKHAIFKQVGAARQVLRSRNGVQRELDHSQAKLEAITAIGELIGSLDLEVLLARLMELTLFLTTAQVGSVVLKTDNGLEPGVEWGLPLQGARSISYANGGSILERTIEQGEPHLIFDFEENENVAPVEGFLVRSFLCIPLISGGRVLGALNLVNSETENGQFTKSASDSVVAVTGLAATAIDNAILHKSEIEKEKIAASLRVAQNIQDRMYQKEAPDVPGLDFSFFTLSCDETGGDYFDFIRPDEKTLYVIIGDVIGHGIGAALLMATARANLKALCSLAATTELGVKEIVDNLNSLLMEDMDERTFMTFFLAKLDLETFSIDFVNAGHDNPVVATKDDAIDLEATGIPLGVMDLGYDNEQFECFREGDCMMLTTDGVWEVTNPKREMYGKARLKERFREIADRAPDEIVKTIREEIMEYVDGVSLADDFTLVVMKRVLGSA